MSATTKIAVGVASGYLLGRTKKLKLAVTVAGLLAGQRLAGRGSLLEQGSKLLDSSPELKKLQDQIRGRLKEAARDAALGVATSRMEQMTKALQGASVDEQEGGEEPPDQQETPSEDQGETPSEDQADDETATSSEDAESEPPPRRRATKKSSSPRPAAKKSSSPRGGGSRKSASSGR
ncbi:hypothetical protein AB3X52_17365 [Nocardioides sp. DS6]|uniref:DNA primase n=1 Tax=Nocardioides eburneus TaxID=3231482 RepID=A0ABV3T2F6_9ACTN